MGMEDSRPTYSELFPGLVDGHYKGRVRVNADAPGQDLDCHKESNENSSHCRKRRVSIGSVGDDDRYGRLNAFIPRDGITYVRAGSSSPITDLTLSQESVCYIQNCEKCTAAQPTPSLRASDSLPAAARDLDPDHDSLSSELLPGQYDGPNHETSSLLGNRGSSGRVRFHEPSMSKLRSRIMKSANRRLSSLFPDEATSELTPLHHTGAAGAPPTSKPGFFKRLASFGRFRR